MRRLSRVEYENSVRTLLRDPALTLPVDMPDDTPGASGFRVAGAFSGVDADRVLGSAELLSARAVASLKTILPCDPMAAGEEACAKQFIDGFGRRAYRRRLEASEGADLLALYRTARQTLGLGFGEAIGHVLSGILQAPQFLYHWELGPRAPARAGTLVRLGPDEVAARLSYFVWSSMPDDELFTAVDAGKLGTPDEVAGQARRLLADSRSDATLAAFFSQFLDFRANPDAYGKSLETELGMFARWVMAGDGKLSTLMTSPTSFVTSTIARKVYGLAATTGDKFQQVMLNPDERFGVLTQAGFLSSHAIDGDNPHPIRRGRAIYENLLCGELPPPPPNVPSPKPIMAGVSNRVRFEAHAQNACAKGCHGVFDGLGFVLEAYDGSGRLRTLDHGLPIDTSGEAVFPIGGPQRFANAKELVQALVRSADLSQCVARQWFRFATARHEEDGDAASLRAIQQAFAGSTFDLRQLLLAIIQSPSFLYRAPATGEVL